jgi:hypothetical protein
MQVGSQGMKILRYFKQTKVAKPTMIIVKEEIDKSRACAYFDGAAQGDPQVSGVGGVLYLRDVLKIKADLGHGSNNYAELMALKLILISATEKGASKIQ